MKAEIVTIGDEILIGQTIDTNSAWMAEQLHMIGVRTNRIVSISDTREAILNAIDDSFSRADMVLLTGGLGPTQDDITKETLAEYFDTTLEINQEVLEGIRSFFASINRPMLESNVGQAALPKAAKILKNTRGTAMGMWFEKEGKILVSMPGVPYEMRGIMSDHVIGMLKMRFKAPEIIHHTVLTVGIGESFLAETLSDWETSLRNEGIFLAYLPSPGLVRLRLTAYASNGNATQLETRIAHYIAELERRVPEHVFGREKQTIAEVVGKLLIDRGQTLSLAESCTGGYIAHSITSIPGSSAYFMGSVVAYSNPAKTAMLDVDADLIAKHGAVSEAVVRAMAEGARKKFNTTYAIATSGVAGPDGGTDEKPVGTVWIALSGPNGTLARVEKMGRSRGRNITVSSLTALNWLRQEILAKALE